MMKLAMVAAVATVGLAGAAQAQSFEEFASICLATDAQPARAHAAATKAGWIDQPQMLEAFQASRPPGGLQPSAVLASPTYAGSILLLGNGRPPSAGDARIAMELCGLITPAISVDNAVAGFQDRMNLGAPTRDDGMAYWNVSRDGDTFRNEPELSRSTAAQWEAVLQDRPVFVSGVAVMGEVQMLMYGRLTPEGAAPGGSQ